MKKQNHTKVFRFNISMLCRSLCMTPVLLMIVATMFAHLAKPATAQTRKQASIFNYYDKSIRARLFPPKGDRHFLTADGGVDAIGVISSSPPYVKTLLGGRTIKLRDVRRSDYGYMITLISGEIIYLSIVPTETRFELESAASKAAFKHFALDDLYILSDGTHIGSEILAPPDWASSTPAVYKCDMVHFGLIRINAENDVMWRKSYASLEKRAPPDRF